MTGPLPLSYDNNEQISTRDSLKLFFYIASNKRLLSDNKLWHGFEYFFHSYLDFYNVFNIGTFKNIVNSFRW